MRQATRSMGVGVLGKVIFPPDFQVHTHKICRRTHFFKCANLFSTCRMKTTEQHMIRLNVDQPLWDRFFTVAPLVLIGTREDTGRDNLAPKHMAFPLGWDNFFAFVCAPTHHTYQNIDRTGSFTVSYLRASNVVTSALAAAPRIEDDTKPSLLSLPTIPAEDVDGSFAADGYLFLACRLDRIIDDFGPNSIIVGKIEDAYVREEALRISEREDEDVVRNSDILAYVSPGRFAAIDSTFNFPFPAGYRR